MKTELEFFKLALRNLDYKNVTSEINDEIEVRVSYEKRNYILHINPKYKIIIIEQIESLKNGKFSNNEYYIIEDLKAIIDYTSFEGYNIMYMSLNENNNIFVTVRELQLVDLKHYNSITIGKPGLYTYKQGIIINKDKGLYEFDNRLFEDNWQEDFNEKLDTYSEEDLFIMIETFSSYFYKVYADKWKGNKLDPFVISYFCEKTIEKTKKYENNFEKWYSFWDEYFTNNELNKYLDKRNKYKNKYRSY